MTDDELKSLFDAIRRENATMRTENAAAHSESRRHFDVASEAMRHEIRLVAEAVAQLDEKLDRRTTELEERMERGFVETQAMIKFSHAELDRRIRTLEQTQNALEETQRSLEETVADLLARVERLESSTH